MSGLTNKQQLFIDAYLECFNATEAARRAGYQGNDNTLGTVGAENLQKPNIAEKIKERLQESAMSTDEALQRLAEMARADIGDFLVYDPESHNFKVDWLAAKGKTHLIKTVKHTAHGIVFELHDSQAALDKILKAGGEYTQKVDVTSGGKPLSFEVHYVNPPPPLDDDVPMQPPERPFVES